MLERVLAREFTLKLRDGRPYTREQEIHSLRDSGPDTRASHVNGWGEAAAPPPDVRTAGLAVGETGSQ